MSGSRSKTYIYFLLFNKSCLYLISLEEEILYICTYLAGLVKVWELVPEFDVSSVRGAKCGKSGYFLSNIQSDTLKDFQPPLGNFLESQ